MKTLVRSSRGQLRYTGQVPRELFDEWRDSPAGRLALERVAARIRFSIFGKMRAARRSTWRQLTEAARAEAIGQTVQEEVNAYLLRLETLVFADGLPTVTVDLRRLIVVPKLSLNWEAYRRLQLALHVQPLFGGLKGGEPLQRWFALAVVDSVTAAVTEARPSMRRPLPAGESWIVVGVDEEFVWQTPFEGPAWPGHYFVLELRRQPITRAVRSAAEEATAQLQTTLQSLSYVDRTEIASRAAASMDQLFGAKRRRRSA